MITAVTEDISRQKTSKGGTEPSVLKSRYIALLHYAEERVLYECGTAFMAYSRARHADELRDARNGANQDQKPDGMSQQQANIVQTEMTLKAGDDITS